jgi:hypothetical protein
LGFSQGIGNVKPGNARDTEEYYLKYYDPESPEYKMAFKMHLEGISGARPETRDEYAAYYVAANLRRQINGWYEVGYNGPISQEGAIHIIGGHNSPNWYRHFTTPSPGGVYGTALIIDKSKDKTGLPFLKR